MQLKPSRLSVSAHALANAWQPDTFRSRRQLAPGSNSLYFRYFGILVNIKLFGDEIKNDCRQHTYAADHQIVVDITPILNLYDFEFAVAGAFAKLPDFMILVLWSVYTFESPDENSPQKLVNRSHFTNTLEYKKSQNTALSF